MIIQKDNFGFEDDSEAFDTAVWSVVTETVPPDALQRIKDRAKALKNETTEEDESLSPAGVDLSCANQDHVDSTPPAPAKRFGWLRIVGPVAIAVSLLAIVAISVLNPTVSLAQVISRTFSRPWVHTTTVRIHDDGTLDDQQLYETWISTDRSIRAFKTASHLYFEDRGQDSAIKYVHNDEKAVQTLPPPPDMIVLDASQTTLEQLLAIEGKSNRLGLTVSNIKQTQLDQLGQLQIDFDLKQAGNPANDRHSTLLVDQETKLAISMTDSHAGGIKLLTNFDYPDTGPTSAVLAGMPESVVVEDRRASTDVRKIEKDWSKCRNDFDVYDSVYVQTPKELKSSVFTGLNAATYRVRKMGDHYRVDYLLSPMPDVEPPTDETDMRVWWSENRDRYYSYPMMICDGSKVTYFDMVEKYANLEKIESNPKIRETMVHPVREFAVWDHLMPEQTCRPTLFLTDGNRRFEYSPTPDDGPADSVRLTSTSIDRSAVHRSTYWLDPSKGFCVLENSRPIYNQDRTLAYVDTEKFLNYTQSPSEFWYPARVERMTTNSPGIIQVRDFYVDFDVELTTDLFETPK